jgi:tetratricopeptide (TPR) repeat protein
MMPKVTRLGPLLLLAVAACAPAAPRSIPRVVDGRVEQGALVSPYAYEWFIAGELSASKGEHEEAAIAFENATAAPVADVLLMTRLAEEYERSGASRRADRALALARRAYPESARVALAEARILQSRGDDQAAIASLVRARRLAPGSDEPVIALAETLRARGQVRRAHAILWDHIRMEPEKETAGARRVAIEMARGDASPEALNEALALASQGNLEARARTAGLLALETGRPALAARIVSAEPASSKNLELRVRALIESGAREEAAELVASSKGKELGDAVDRARLLIETGRPGPALGLLKTVRPSPSARHVEGRALLVQGRYLDAAAVLAHVPFGAADFESARLWLADCASSRGRLGAAAESLAMVPHGSLASRRKLAEIHVAAGDLRSALRLFHPKSSSDRAVLASLLEQAGQYEQAAAFYAATPSGAAEEPRLRARIASEQLASRGQLPGAIIVLEQWTSFAPEDLYARVRLIELLQAEGRTDRALEEGRRALELITDPLLDAHLKRLMTEASRGSVLSEKILDAHVERRGDLVE